VNKPLQFVNEMPVASQAVTAIVVKENGDVYQAQSKTDKRRMFGELKAGDRTFAVWTGKWSSDLFELPVSELVKV
jgi:hypothetical protein